MRPILAIAVLAVIPAFAYAHNLPIGTTWQSDYILGKRPIYDNGTR